MSLERKKALIIEELYVTGRFKGEYMGKYSNKPINGIKAYIKQWLKEKGIRENLNDMIEDFYQELFVHIGKIKAESLVELSKNNKKLFATICTIIQRQLMKVDVNPIINHIKKTLDFNQQELESELNKVTVTTSEFKDLKKVTKKQLKAMDEPTEEYLLKLLKVHMEIQANKIPSTNVSYFEKLKHNSSIYHSDAKELFDFEDSIEDSENLFTSEYGMSINDVMEEMESNELKDFKQFANNTDRKKLKGLSNNEREIEKKYWDNLETNVLNTVNRIKFNK